MKFYMCPSVNEPGEEFHRIDYAKYVAGEKDFYYADGGQDDMDEEELDRILKEEYGV